MKFTKRIAKPFVKWAGGKTQLINDIYSEISFDAYTYIEPFVGGGALLFYLLSHSPELKKVVINDINTDLINTYKVIKNNVEELICLLKKWQDEYYNVLKNEERKKKYYYKKRTLFNERISDKITQSALFIFLNKTCFNGLYRVNRKNEFNVPIGSYKKPLICDAENLKSVHLVLQNVEILNGDFEQTLFYAEKETLFYFDPPYKPLSETSSFNSYAKDEFNDDEQIRLANFCKKIDKLGYNWILSNSDVKGKNPKDNFFDDLFKDFQINRVLAKRSINANSNKRGQLTELLITNRKKNMKKSFNQFLKELSVTNSTLDFFVDFDKISANVDEIAIKLNQLNYLIGKEDLQQAVQKLFEENPKCFSVLNILIAVRDNRPILDDYGNVIDLISYFETPGLVFEFIEKTGLSNVLKNKQIKNLVDYVFGIEVGLDTNARKNRGGKNMEKAIAKIFTKNNIPFRSEVRHTEFKELTSLGKDIKRFDFVVVTKKKTYFVEANYYNSGGSKLNEVARAYTDLAPKISQYDKFEFVWITDGQGWLSAKNKLQEAYTHIPLVFNLKGLPEFIKRIKAEI